LELRDEIPCPVKIRPLKLSGDSGSVSFQGVIRVEGPAALHDGPDDMYQLVHAGDKGCLLPFPGSDEAFVKALQDRVETGCGSHHG